MAMRVSAMIGPRMDQVVVLVIGLPDTAPNPAGTFAEVPDGRHTAHNLGLLAHFLDPSLSA
jgi:hypothetical protein